MSEQYSCKNDHPYIRQLNNNSFNENDIEGIINIVLVILVFAFSIYGYKFSKTFNIYYKIALIFLAIFIYRLYINNIGIIYMPSSIISMTTRTPEFLDKAKFFPNYIKFENKDTFLKLQKEVKDMIMKTDNGNKLKLMRDTFGGAIQKAASDIKKEGGKTIGWKFMVIKVGNEYSKEALNNFPNLVRVLDDVPEIVTCAISVLEKGVRIPIHVGYYKGIIRYMLPVIVPKDRENVFLCVNEIKYNWTEGEGLVFDDTYPHKVYNNTDEIRVVIFIDVIRPLSNRLLSTVNNYLVKLFSNSSIVQDEVRKTEVQIKL